MAKSSIRSMRPQDILILLKIVSLPDGVYRQIILATDLDMSQAEVSNSLRRSQYAGLLSPKGEVMRAALHEFLVYGIKYVFPTRPGALVRGVPTAHSAPPLNELIASDELYVWPSGHGTARGQAIDPLYHTVPHVAEIFPRLYAILALVDALRVGRARERNFANELLKDMLVDGK